MRHLPAGPNPDRVKPAPDAAVAAAFSTPRVVRTPHSIPQEWLVVEPAAAADALGHRQRFPADGGGIDPEDARAIRLWDLAHGLMREMPAV